MRLGDHQLDHVGEPAPFGEGGPLPVGRVAARERRLGQLVDLGPVAELLQLGPEPLEQRPDRPLGGQRLRVAGVVQQRAGQPAARGLPDRRPVHRRRHRIEGPPVGDVAFGGEDRGAEQAGDQDRVVDDRARVAGAQLQGRRVGGRADVEVGHLRVGDHAGVDQVGEQLVVLGGRAQPPGRAGTRPALPDDRADARVPGVLLVPVRRAGRQREQDRQVARHPLHDLHREVAVTDPDVDLQTADQLLVDQQPILLLHPAVAPRRGEFEVGERRTGRGAGRRDPDVVLGGHLDQTAPEPQQLGPQGGERVDHVGVGLDRGSLDLRGIVVGRQPGQQRRCARRQLPALLVDQVQLFLGTQGQFGTHRWPQ